MTITPGMLNYRPIEIFYKTLCWNNIYVFLNKNIAFDLGAVLLKQLLF